jgi:hypothetical protein
VTPQRFRREPLDVDEDAAVVVDDTRGRTAPDGIVFSSDMVAGCILGGGGFEE